MGPCRIEVSRIKPAGVAVIKGHEPGHQLSVSFQSENLAAICFHRCGVNHEFAAKRVEKKIDVSVCRNLHALGIINSADEFGVTSAGDTKFHPMLLQSPQLTSQT